MGDKKGEVSQYRARLDKSLASPELTNHESLKGLVRDQMLQSRLDGNEGCSENLLDRRTTDVSNCLDMLRSASDIGNDSSKQNEPPSGAWKVKDNNQEYRVMYRPGLQGTPFHTLLVEGYVDGPLDACLCIGWESTLYRKWWPHIIMPPFKITVCQRLKRVRIGEQISLVRVKVTWPLQAREVVLHYVLFEYLKEGITIVLLNSIPDSEAVDVNTHGFTKEGIPEPEDVVRADLVGALALQKVSSTRSYFRTIATVDLKLDFVPPVLINFISRQLIGSGFRLFQKAVASLCKKDDEEYVQALADPFYARIREAIYAADGQHLLPQNDHSIPPEERSLGEKEQISDEDDSLPERFPTAQKKEVNEIEEYDSEENALLTDEVEIKRSEHKDEKNSLGGEILQDVGLLAAEMYSSDDDDEGIAQASASTVRIAEKSIVKSENFVAINPEVKLALETLEKAILMVRNSKNNALVPPPPTVTQEEASNLETGAEKDFSFSIEVPSVDERPAGRTSHDYCFTTNRHSGSSTVTREPNHKKVAPASPEPCFSDRTQVSTAENVNNVKEATLMDQFKDDDGEKLASGVVGNAVHGNGVDKGVGMQKKKHRWFVLTGSHGNGLQQRGKKKNRLCCLVPGSGSVN